MEKGSNTLKILKIQLEFNFVLFKPIALYNLNKQTMKSFTEKYSKLKDEVINKYNELKVAGVDFVQKALVEYAPNHRKEIKAIIASKDFRDLADYDFQEFLPSVYYNNKRGEEKQAYVFSVTEKEGILVMDSEDNTKVFYIGFNDINALWSQIELLDCMD